VLDLQLADRRFLVTGATRGLGRAIAAALVAQGAKVAAFGREIDLVPDGVSFARAVDVMEPGAAADMVALTRENVGGLDAVIAVAGRSMGGNFEDIDDQRWAEGLNLNLLSVIRLCRAAIPTLRESTAGRIVLFGAVSGIEPRSSHAISNIAKAGIHVLAKTLSRELADDGILVNCIAPGRIRGGQLDRAFADEAARRARAAELVPLGRFGEPEEAAPLALLLASPTNTYITGQTIAVDGGMTWRT